MKSLIAFLIALMINCVIPYKILGVFPVRYVSIRIYAKNTVRNFLKLCQYNYLILDHTKKIIFFCSSFKSHWGIGHSIMKTLANAGHEVHMISPFPLKKPIPNYNDIHLVYDNERKYE